MEGQGKEEARALAARDGAIVVIRDEWGTQDSTSIDVLQGLAGVAR